MSLAARWNRARWRYYAPIYDIAAKPFERGRQQAIRQLDPQRGERVLIVGCGTGLDLAHLPTEAAITALDLHPSNVKRTEARARALGHDVDARVGDAESLPFADDSFDAVLLHLLLAVVPNPQAVAAEAARVLDADGRVSVFDKFIADGSVPSLPRRALNPMARILFSDLTRRLGPIFAGTELELDRRAWVLGGLYSVATARPCRSEPLVQANVPVSMTVDGTLCYPTPHEARP
jgi:ubiquinone/menaquinone biosynthesis C-methylase UbiE